LTNDGSPGSVPTIGKFQVIRQLGRGGMAEVFVCRLQGIGGFDKEVVLKRILPERADDPHFVKMFLDEARMAANLSHPNIVQVFEIGEHEGLPFMTMEYIKGPPLGMIIRQAHRQKKIHYGHSAKIIAGICDALDYAHNAAGPDGLPLGLIHRDVTPGNIMVSSRGAPKLLDFGVAKAHGRLAETEAGTIKGKLRYMAPEQITQGPVDQRADIFSLGVCLYEFTVGQHPYGPRNSNELATLKSIMSGVISRPRDVVPNYPPILEEIVLSAIHMDVHQRCPSAAEFRDRLESFVAGTGLQASSRELVGWLREILPNFNGMTQTGSMPVPSRSNSTGSPPLTPSAARPDWASPVPVAQSQPRAEPAGPPRPARGRKRAGEIGVALAIAIAAVSLLWLRARPPEVQPDAEVALSRKAPVAMTEEDSVVADLDAIEKLIAEKRLDPALEIAARVKERGIHRWDLNIRLSRVSEMLTTAVMVRTAALLLQEENWRGAMDAARTALGREPENQAALQIVERSRAALRKRRVEHEAEGVQ
jgi:serine/threonine protein kinase